jgi:hypothetical protein
LTHFDLIPDYQTAFDRLKHDLSNGTAVIVTENGDLEESMETGKDSA